MTKIRVAIILSGLLVSLSIFADDAKRTQQLQTSRVEALTAEQSIQQFRTQQQQALNAAIQNLQPAPPAELPLPAQPIVTEPVAPTFSSPTQQPATTPQPSQDATGYSSPPSSNQQDSDYKYGF